MPVTSTGTITDARLVVSRTASPKERRWRSSATGGTLLVIREAFTGARRFADFEQNLGISKNVLAQRLAHLVANGVFERVDVGRHGIHYEYALAPRGRDLATVMTALRQWGDRWVFGEGHEPLVVRDRRTGRPIPPLRIRGDDGEPLSARDMEIVLGPGASPRTVERYRRASRTPKSPSQRSTPR